MQGQYPQSAQEPPYVSCQPGIAPPQRSRWGGEPALSPVASRVPRVLGPPHTPRGRVASSVLLRARGSCESRVSDPSHAAQGDPTKRTVDNVCDHTSGQVLPVAAPEALRADRSLLIPRLECFGIIFSLLRYRLNRLSLLLQGGSPRCNRSHHDLTQRGPPYCFHFFFWFLDIYSQLLGLGGRTRAAATASKASTASSISASYSAPSRNASTADPCLVAPGGAAAPADAHHQHP